MDGLQAGIDVLVEPIDPCDIKDFFQNCQDEVHRSVQAIGAHNLKAELDLYHRQIVESELAVTIRQYLPTSCFAHFHIGDVPTPR